MRMPALHDDGTRGSEATTHGVRVKVRPLFVPEQSAPMEGKWLFSYEVQLFNDSMETVQLLGRHWVITDATGSVEEVSGLGVVGEQPILAPGETYEYESFYPLSTPFGNMRGSFRMKNSTGVFFDVRIATFELSLPLKIN